MGACIFQTIGYGDDAHEAFYSAQEEAREMNGDQEGYSGDIQTVKGYTEITLKEGQTLYDILEEIEDYDTANGNPINKWNNCACIKLTEGKYAFIGWGAE